MRKGWPGRQERVGEINPAGADRGERQTRLRRCFSTKGCTLRLSFTRGAHELPGTVFDVVASGSRECVDLTTLNPSQSARLLHEGTPPIDEEVDRIHDNLDMEGVWYKSEQVSKSLSQLGVDAGRAFSSLSAGLKRQVLLKRALVGEPDILLLNEPTNHMAIDSIKELEQMMVRFTGAFIFVTHDRMFLQ